VRDARRRRDHREVTGNRRRRWEGLEGADRGIWWRQRRGQRGLVSALRGGVCGPRRGAPYHSSPSLRVEARGAEPASGQGCLWPSRSRLGCAAALVPADATAAPGRPPRVCLVLAGGPAPAASAHIGRDQGSSRSCGFPWTAIAGTRHRRADRGCLCDRNRRGAEMEKIVAGLSTEALFVDRPPRSELPIRTKIDEQRNFVGPRVRTGATASCWYPRAWWPANSSRRRCAA